MSKVQQIVLAGGCFWCTEAVFQRINGVMGVRPGFAGGFIKNPPYREVVTGRTGHAECVEISYNPNKVSFVTILEIYFSTHDPTTLNRQGHDIGTQYRSEVFYTTEEQRKQTLAVIRDIESQGVFNSPIVTKVSELDTFYPAELEHHNYYNDHRAQPYCSFVIDPKIKKLKDYFSTKLKST